MHEKDDAGASSLFDLSDQTLPRALQKALPQDGLHRGKQEEQPNQLPDVHVVILSRRLGPHRWRDEPTRPRA